MTSRERVILAINHKEPDRVPRFDAFWDETLALYGYKMKIPAEKVEAYLAELFEFDIQLVSLDNSMRFDAYVAEDNDDYMIIEDRCGYKALRHKGRPTLQFLEHKNDCYETWLSIKDRFSLDRNGTSRVDIDTFFLRTTTCPAWEEAIRKINKIYENGKFTLLNFYGPFEGTWRHHGYENSLMDLVADEDYTREMFDGITNVTIESIQYALNLGMKIDGIFMVEDLGSTRTTLMSPAVYRDVISPYHKKLGDFLKKNGLRFFMHSCGDVSDLIPYFIDVGIEVLQPMQANTTMHVVNLKQKYGKDITFWGNIDETKIADGREAIDDEVAHKIVPAMKGGGYIFHSDHSIPPTVPLENYKYLIHMLDKYAHY